MNLVKREKINPKKMLQDYSDRILQDLQKYGVDFFEPVEKGGSLNIDNEYLSLPLHITEISSKDLGEYLNAFTQQKMYMRTLVGNAELLCEEALREYISVSENIYRSLLNSKLSESAKEREVNSNENVRPYYEKYIDLKNKVKLLNLNITSIEEAVFMLSREVSRRNSDFEQENRDYNVQENRIRNHRR